ncbi:SCO family protein [Polaribacter cellanae]|uniref:SCO family protein n=1 Tax=Polaribacter cellanae TaxID=2818493 RepID=A0A975CTN4_9FLAO|nr:SCO family protein [Polaribacter cellanae]QTE23186.1 SCO family protein [Polaribacter cellanae]
MKQIIKIAIFVTIILLVSCDKKETKKVANVGFQCPMKCEGEKLYQEKGICPVCKMDLRPINKLTKQVKKVLDKEISEQSIFNLTSKWNTEEGKTIELKELKGKTLVMVMIYTTCKAACPRLSADMRNIEAKIPKNLKDGVQYVLVSIDPKTDTPKRLKKYAIENYMDGKQWTFLQGTESGVREFANVLSVKYKQIDPLDFSHSNIISVFNPQGELVHQQEGLGVDNKETIEKIIETVNNK